MGAKSSKEWKELKMSMLENGDRYLLLVKDDSDAEIWVRTTKEGTLLDFCKFRSPLNSLPDDVSEFEATDDNLYSLTMLVEQVKKELPNFKSWRIVAVYRQVFQVISGT